MKPVAAVLKATRYGEVEKQIQRESDPVKRGALQRDLRRGTHGR